ncbi:FadR family transcriptional regulator [Gordonia sp. TBRC 11910]|uniref:FadR family transcriptional regulator n=1 Tax=Gordonia asplenii TaxID=2725283 RepID=A0A848KR09_9ACTN|nr:FCD domain-containing protein [Gordonia asplenii]NMO00682.1 FadR family transcriptional regulator [Gordonia asplenii]
MFSVPLTRAQSLAAEIEGWIVDRSLRPGDRIATMDELREQTRLGRASISEAARLLAERGTVDVRPGRGGGLFVAQSGTVVQLRHTLLSVSSDPQSVADAVVVRDALEEAVDVDAAEHCTAGDAADLYRIVADMERHASDRESFLRANWTLHRRIAEITRNTFAKGVYLSAMAHVEGLPSQPDRDTAADDSGYLHERVDVHVELVRAITANDAARTKRAVAAHRAVSTQST